MPENFVELRKELIFDKKRVVRNVAITSAVGFLGFEVLQPMHFLIGVF